MDPIVELLLKWSVGVVGSTTGSKWWEHTRLTLTAAAITPRMKRAQRDCCYGTMTPISFPHHKKYCASPIRSLNWFLVTILCRLSTDFLSSPWAKLLFTVEIFLLESSNLLSRNHLNGFYFPHPWVLCILPVHSVWIKFVFLTPLFLIRFLPICTQKVWVLFKPFTLLLIRFFTNLYSKSLGSF